MKKPSAGLVVYRQKGKILEVLLVHPGGPFWAKKDQGAWSIPKGEFDENEDRIKAAKREFQEELGVPPPTGPWIELGSITRADGRPIVAWAVEGDIDVSKISSNQFELEWPPKSGQIQKFPEVDKAAWIEMPYATTKLHKGQDKFIARLAAALHLTPPAERPQQGSLL